MNRRILILGALLTLQLLLALWLLAPRSSSVNGLPALALGEADRIEIASADQRVTLARVDGQWRLPEHYALPANAEGVKLLRERIEQLAGLAPVATSTAAQARFKVSEREFERSLSFHQGDKLLARVYLGSPASRNRSHVRLDGLAAIVEAPIALYEVRTDEAGWVDSRLLHLPREQIRAISIGSLRLQAGEPPADASANAGEVSWQAEGLPAGRSLDAAAAARLVTQLAELNFDAALGTEDKPAYGLAKPLLEIVVERDGAEPRRLSLGKIEGEEAYALRLSDRAERFRLLPYQATPLIEASKPETLAPGQ